MDKKTILQTVRDMIHSSKLKEAHRINDKALTRDRTLTFSLLIVMM